jgi:TonB-dependent receptor
MGSSRTKLRHNPLAIACATALMLAAGSAQAADVATAEAPAAAATDAVDAPADQADPAATGTEEKKLKSVKVVGIRRGIEDAIDTKKASTSIVETISAEDIGKLPDVSIAESLARLPGLSAQRVAGRAQVISVRGLSPDFSTSLLNGRQMVSTGDNRSVEYDQYPSELMAGVTVYKTPDAALVGQGLSGTLDMRTVRPLDFAEGVVAISGRLTHNSLGSAADSDADGNRFNISWITQNADRTVGFAIGYSHSDTPVQENQVGLYEPWNRIGSTWRPDVPSGAGCPDVGDDCTYFSDGIKALRRTGATKRDAVMATLQFRPSSNWESTFDVFHSEATQEDTARQFEVNLSGYNGGYAPGMHFDDPIVNGNDTFVGAHVTGSYPLVRGMYNKREDEINAVGWNNKWNWGKLAMNADVSWSRSTRDELSLENNLQKFPAPQLDTLDLAFDSDDFSQINPGMDYSQLPELLLTGTIYGSGYGKTPKIEDELWSVKLSANLPSESDLFSSYDFGVNYDDRAKEKHQPENDILLGSQGPMVIPNDLQQGRVDLGFAGIGWIPAWDVPEVVNRFMIFNPVDDKNYLVAKTWSVDEQVTSAWFQANIDTTWGDVPVRGNIGLQAQHVDQSSDSFYWDGSQPAGQNRLPISGGKDYTDWLPSMNLSFNVADDAYIRVAAARQVARPRMDQLRSSLEFNVSTTPPDYKASGNGGNPELDPWRANAFDLSFEKYFGGTKGYVAAAFFYKDLRTYIFEQTRDRDFSSFIDELEPGSNIPASPIGDFRAPYNGKGGSMQGLELTASIPFELFSESLRGFGITANASFNDSSISIIADSDSQGSVGSAEIDLPGLSKRVYNFTAYYENNGFEARINNRRRSDFIGEIGDFAANRKLRYVEGENITDAQISYQFPEGSSLEGLGLLLQGQNLTNEKYHTYAGTKDRPLETIEWGKTILFGATYKF